MSEHGTKTKRADGTIMTFTGRIVRPLAIRPEDIDIRDIAHALAMKCRYTGHCRQFYSVGQHSLLMARWKNMPGPAAWRLMHDASEAYVPDIASPIKSHFPVIIAAEARIQWAVGLRFGLQPYATAYPDVHLADTWMMVWEGRNNMDDMDHNTCWWKLDAPAHVLDHEFHSMPPEYTERMFLKEAKCLLDL